MHLRSVELFLEVAQQRSFSKGAVAHGVSQSSASQAVQTLEERLGAVLIDRSKRPLELTPVGEVFYEGCRDVVARYRAVEDAVLRMQDRVVGVVRVAAIYSVGLLQMERFTTRFKALYPDADVEIEYLHPDAVYARVLDDTADLGLVSYANRTAEIEVAEWQAQPMVLVVNPAHPLAGRERVTLADLEGVAFVAFTDDLKISREIRRVFRKAKVHVDVEATFDNVEMIKQGVRCGKGVSILPRPTLREEEVAGTLVAIPLADVSLVRPMGIVHRRGRELTTATRRFIDLLGQDPDRFATTSTGESSGVATVEGEGRSDENSRSGDSFTTEHPADGPVPHEGLVSTIGSSGISGRRQREVVVSAATGAGSPGET